MDFPFTATAFQQALWLLHDAWIAEAARLKTSTAYQDGIQAPVTLEPPFTGVIQNTSADADRVEQGQPAVHLPSVIRWGQTPGSRLSKAGVWFIRVPFRHGSPRSTLGGTVAAPRQTMPRGIYAVARLLQPGQRLTAGPTRGAARHAPGMTPYVPQNPRNVRPGYTHASIYEGMRRTPHAHGRGGSYVTFRTMTQHSPGWWLPARPGHAIPDDVARAQEPNIRAMMDEAIAADVAAMIQTRLGG